MENYFDNSSKFNNLIINEEEFNSIIVELKKIIDNFKSKEKNKGNKKYDLLLTKITKGTNINTYKNKIILLLQNNRSLNELYIPNFNKFAQLITSGRHIVAHAKSFSNFKSTFKELQQLKTLLIVIILIECGWDEDNIKIIIKRIYSNGLLRFN